MCGIAGTFNKKFDIIENLDNRLEMFNRILAHRGPDGEGLWKHVSGYIGFAHRRLSIIDLDSGNQPMTDEAGNWITFNGEIYNYLELKEELGKNSFNTKSDTEVILAAYRKWGEDCVGHFRGMFAFALWDNQEQKLFCCRDRFGIKPFYYNIDADTFSFASETKALLPLLNNVEIDSNALKDYLVFQLYLDGKTLFKGILELLPGHKIVIKSGMFKIERYWDVFYQLDFDHTPNYFQNRLRELVEESVMYHLRSDVPVGSYISGGVDSGIVASLAANFQNDVRIKGFNGKFELGELYDESVYARELSVGKNIDLYETSITSKDFTDNIAKIIYHLDYPIAGPGSFPQFMVSQTAASQLKVILGGQGGDEIFGGYTRYLIAYFEQCIKGAIDGTLNNGNFVVTYQSIIPNLVSLKNYKPLLKEFWSNGLFEDYDKRYFRLINRGNTLQNEINWGELEDYSSFQTFGKIFNAENVGSNSYFDKMTHFDFKTLLPGLLQVEDRMSMAWGLESRVPFLDHYLVEFAATMPANIKFKDGTLKMALVNAFKNDLPASIVNRKNKMGFPVPLNEWMTGELRNFVLDIFLTQKNRKREIFNTDEIIKNIESEPKFGRKIWGLLSLELWHQEFIDKNNFILD